MRICAVIPHYDHVEQFAAMLPVLLQQGLPLIIVDDASPDEAFQRLENLLEKEAPDASLIRHAKNQGKGGAVMTALEAAFDSGYSHALQVDADGQHDAEDISRFVAEAARHPGSLICGQPIFDQSISRMRYYSRFITLIFCWAETWSKEIRDALCGFRVYPLALVAPLIRRKRIGRRMAFDPEILVRCVWAGIRLRYIPVHVQYPEGGRSHFRYFRDNLEISWMHTRLIFEMPVRLHHIRQQRAQTS